MRVTIVLAILIFSFSLVPCSNVYAKTTSSASQSANLLQNLALDQAGAVDLGRSRLSPDSPFYFLKSIREKIETALAKTRPQQVSKQLEFSIRRLKEVNSLIADKHSDLIAPTLQQYQSDLDQAIGAADKNRALQTQVGLEISRHLDVLSRDYDQVGNPAAKTAIRAAVEKIINSNRQTAKNIGSDFSQQVVARQAQGCQFMQKVASSGDVNGTTAQYLNAQVQNCTQNINATLVQP